MVALPRSTDLILSTSKCMKIYERGDKFVSGGSDTFTGTKVIQVFYLCLLPKLLVCTYAFCNLRDGNY
jgi:hypothetical protein